jgi:23S rRNA pseudouridine955/2504/2580 synthase
MPGKRSGKIRPEPAIVYMKKNDLEKDSARRLKIDDSADSQRLDNYLMARLKGVPKSRIYKMVRNGEVRINGGRADVSYRLQLGDEVRIPPVRTAAPLITPATHLPQGGIRLVPRILYRDEALIALNKPAGMAVHGGSGISRGVIEQLRLELPQCRYVELVHRLDRETSGVLLVALKRRALVGLHAAMRDGKVEKRYLTLVAGRWPNPLQHVKLPLHKRVTDDGEKRVTVRDEGRSAHTIFRRLQGLSDFTLLEAELKTGRTHQIRVHTSHLGFPIAGDDKYGDFELNKALAKQGLKRMFLHAATLVFDHPISGEKMLIKAPLPADLATFLDTLNAP